MRCFSGIYLSPTRPSRTPLSVTHQVTLCLIRLCGNGWPREPHASKQAGGRILPLLRLPQQEGTPNYDLQDGGWEANSCRRLHQTIWRSARAASANRPNARGFRSRSMLPWEGSLGGSECYVWPGGMDVPKRAGGQQPGDGTSTCRAVPNSTGDVPGLSMPSFAVWVHVFPSNRLL